MSVQTRSQQGEILEFPTVTEALAHAESDRDVWKISFEHAGERVRLVRNENEKFELDLIDLARMRKS